MKGQWKKKLSEKQRIKKQVQADEWVLTKEESEQGNQLLILI